MEKNYKYEVWSLVTPDHKSEKHQQQMYFQKYESTQTQKHKSDMLWFPEYNSEKHQDQRPPADLYLLQTPIRQTTKTISPIIVCTKALNRSQYTKCSNMRNHNKFFMDVVPKPTTRCRKIMTVVWYKKTPPNQNEFWYRLIHSGSLIPVAGKWLDDQAIKQHCQEQEVLWSAS